MEAKKILIIEDEQSLAKVLEIKLQKSGYAAKAVFDGATGLRELEGGGYDLALLDLLMPGVDGWQVLSQVKAKGIKTKMIVATNLSSDDDQKKALDLGAVDYILKSDSTLNTIIDKISSVLSAA